MMFRKPEESSKYCNLAVNTHGKLLQTYCAFDKAVLQCQEHLFDSYLNFLYIVTAVSVGWRCPNPDSPFAGMRLMWFTTWQTNRGNVIFSCSFYCAPGKHTVAGRILSVTSSSFSFIENHKQNYYQRKKSFGLVNPTNLIDNQGQSC